MPSILTEVAIFRPVIVKVTKRNNSWIHCLPWKFMTLMFFPGTPVRLQRLRRTKSPSFPFMSSMLHPYIQLTFSIYSCNLRTKTASAICSQRARMMTWEWFKPLSFWFFYFWSVNPLALFVVDCETQPSNGTASQSVISIKCFFLFLFFSLMFHTNTSYRHQVLLNPMRPCTMYVHVFMDRNNHSFKTKMAYIAFQFILQ